MSLGSDDYGSAWAFTHLVAMQTFFLLQDSSRAFLGFSPLPRGPWLCALSRKTIPFSILFWFLFPLVPVAEDVYMDASLVSSVGNLLPELAVGEGTMCCSSGCLWMFSVIALEIPKLTVGRAERGWGLRLTRSGVGTPSRDVLCSKLRAVQVILAGVGWWISLGAPVGNSAWLWVNPGVFGQHRQ